MSRKFSLAAIAATAVFFVLCHPAFAADLVISQVYGGGGNAGAQLKNDFIEVFNRGSAPIPLGGMSVQYASTTGNLGSSGSLTLLPAFTLQPGQYFLIREAPGAGGTVDLANPDAIGSIAMSASGGKVALVNSTAAVACNSAATCAGTPIIDLIGYDGANFFEIAAAPALSNTTAAIRANDGCVDTDNNSADFVAAAPNPRNSSSPIKDCAAPTPLSIAAASATPSGVSAGDNTTLTVTVSPGGHPTSSGITVTGDLSSIGGSTSQTFGDNGNGAFSFTATVASNISTGTKTIPVTASDAQSRNATASITLTVTAAVPRLAIHDVQGAGIFSPFANTVVQVEGVVTARKTNGFFIQLPDSEADADPNTSEGIFVFTSSTPSATAAVGNRVAVRGRVQDFIPASDPLSPPVTEIAGTPTITLVSSGNPLPPPVTLTAANYDPAGSVSQLARYEGMRVHVDTINVVAPSGGSINEANATSTSTGSFYGVFPGVARPFREPGIEAPAPAPAGVPQFDANPERVRVDTKGSVGSTVLDVATGAVVSNLTGPLDFTFRSYTILTDPGSGATASNNDAHAVPVRAGAGEGELVVASFNMERFFDTYNDVRRNPFDPPLNVISDAVLTQAALDRRLNKASLAIRNVLQMPDIIGIEEMENPLPPIDFTSFSTTPTREFIAPAPDNRALTSVILLLAAKIDSDAVAAGQTPPNYQAYEAVSNDIGGIACAFLVKPSRIEAVDVSVIDGATRPYNYVQVDLTSALLNDRPPLVLTANVKPVGKELPFAVTAIVNHLRSLSGIEDPLDGPRIQAKRLAQAEFLASLIDSYQGEGRKVISVGDYNAFDVNDGYADVINTVRGGPPHPSEDVRPEPAQLVATPLIDLAPADAAQHYSYVFDGNAQVLDHIIVSQSLTVNEFTYARNDADFPEVLRNDATRPERISDHDMPVAYFAVPRDTVPPLVTLTGPADGAAYRSSTVPAASCTTTDDGSGVKTPATLSITGGPIGPVTATCTGAVDNVGNAAADVSVTYVVDDTPPSVTLNGPADGAYYNPAGVPAATCMTTDSGSGVQTQARLSLTGGLAGAVTATCSDATDKAGNIAAAVSVTYFVDGTPPTVTLGGPAEGADYSLSNAPAATCTTADTGSGVLIQATLVVTGGPTGAITATCTGAVDKVGNIAADVSVHYFVDGMPPAVTLNGPVEGAFYSLATEPAATCTTTDDLSGVRTPAFLVMTGGPAGPLTATCTGAVDNVGNAAADVSVHFFVDVTPPAVTLNGPADGATYLLGTVPAASCPTTDTESGVRTNATLSISGGPLGAVTAKCSGAVDNVGNLAADVSVHYRVVAYTFGGFQAPLGPDTRSVKGGSTVPVKFQIFDWNGALVTDTAVIAGIEVARNAGCSGTPDDGWSDATSTGGTVLRFDGGQFIFNWKTGGLSAGCYSVGVKTVDTLTHAASVAIR